MWSVLTMTRGAGIPAITTPTPLKVVGKWLPSNDLRSPLTFAKFDPNAVARPPWASVVRVGSETAEMTAPTAGTARFGGKASGALIPPDGPAVVVSTAKN